MDAFLAAFEQTLRKMPRAEFEKHRTALVAAKLEKARSLAEESDRHWAAIWSQRYDFHAKQQVRMPSHCLLPSLAPCR